MDDEDFSKIYDKMRHVLEVGKEYCREGHLAPSSYLLHQRHEDAECPRCEAELKTIKVSVRTSYYCPQCQ